MMSVPSLWLSLAGVNISLQGKTPGKLNVFFEGFQGVDTAKNDFCTLDFAGATEALITAPCHGTWSFQQAQNGLATVEGSNEKGQVLWRLRGAWPFERLSFTWHPTAFMPLCADPTFDMLGNAVAIALVLRLLPLNGLLLHASAQVIDDSGIICAGPSGCGKSTISKIFHQCQIPVLSDERPLVRMCATTPSGFRVYGSPWPSSGGFVKNSSAALRKIYFLEHGAAPALLPLTKREALLRLLEGALVPWLSADFFDPLLPVLEKLILQVPYALLRFRPDDSVVALVRQDLDASVPMNVN